MRSGFNKFRSNQTEVGWISTADVFIFGTCFLLLLFLATSRSKSAVVSDLTELQKLQTRQEEQVQHSLAQLQSTGSQLDELKKELEKSRRDLKSEKSKADTELQKLQTMQEEQVQHSLAQLQSTGLQLDELKKELDKSRLELRSEKSKAENLAAAERGKREDLEAQQRRLNNKLVGLGGRLENVVLLVDVSRSMKGDEFENGIAKDNWHPTLEIIERWINNLEVKAAALILFGEVAELKFEMQILDRQSREKIIDILKQVDPSANATNFLDAFRTAYEIPNVDTIIVFSDGLPSVDVEGNKISGEIRKSGETQEEFNTRRDLTLALNVERVLAVHKKISAEAREHPGIVINAIGLGDKVYTRQTGNLLNELALANGGIFLAVPSKVNDGQ